MDTKYIFITGGVVSGLGKGITSASLGRLLKARRLSVRALKLDPYLNIDPGTMNPIQHGEVFVTDDGAETDLDLGHYERFIDISLTRSSVCTAGLVYDTVLSNERKGVYGGKTVQVIPHITNEIKRRIALNSGVDVVLCEIGGTVGDIESLPFLEAIRQFSYDVGVQNCMHIHVSLIPYLSASMELKTKPTQHSVKELLSIGIRPDVIVCRTEHPIDDEIKQKIALFCNVPAECVIENGDMDSLYRVPLALESEGLADICVKRLGLRCKLPDLTDWKRMVERSANLTESIKIALVGKYIALHDSYLSVVEALKHAGIANDRRIDLQWIDSETLSEENAGDILGQFDGIIIPGGFGTRGIEGMITAAEFARVNKIPYLGICLGMQIAIIEFARHVLNLPDAHSSEMNPETPDPVIDLMPDQKGVEFGGTMRLGQYPCRLAEGSKIMKQYGERDVFERHRHRYEVNNNYRERLEANGMWLCGVSPDDVIVEMIELRDHPWFAATQAHPEFKSRPNRPHPLFNGFIAAATALADSKKV